MPSKSDKKNKGGAMRIEGEMTIFRAAELAQALQAGPPPAELDLSGVTEIDCAGLQLLLLAKKKALADKRALSLVGHSAAVTEVFELLNVTAYFGDPLVVPPRASA
ncbi:Anti-sigma-factor antagonist (STAS) domain protein [Rubrivivax sp. A210]|uniref:STAS domain-containing protein n=1 Tax=Rubrivivax sp. A210 TaxID=2772301 RepID=UPI00191A3B3B|nr:STAS domain-containing protein [Rubrivivax sp. A210]CAD5374662.1 Anti-sigma-factor antagonist (STAS) domain protein [Rubrivivax sp. A210]